MTSATVVWKDLPREFGDCSLEVDVCTCASQQSSQRSLDCSVTSHTSQLAKAVPLVSIVISQGDPPFALHFVFCGMLMQPSLACVAALQCALGMRVPSDGAHQVPPVPGPPASGLRVFSFSLLCVHLSAASIRALLRMILECSQCWAVQLNNWVVCLTAVFCDPLGLVYGVVRLVAELDLFSFIDIHACTL